MDPLHSAALTVGLFALTFLSPGPNLLLIVQSSLSGGRGAGFAAGLGVALGDAFYAALGLAGMSALIQVGGSLFALVQVAGGAYLLWFGFDLVRKAGRQAMAVGATGAAQSLRRYFWRGLLTDLANAQTVLFFASIFAVTLHADTPAWARLLAWSGIVLTSVLWRLALSTAFSRARVRAAYARAQGALERLAGVALMAFGLRLVCAGLGRR
ncbi:MAG TPA: LysE family transporter [Casimicrobiaceae bacterium]|nr:LysE family transporter [Casimicrobiaceae bacterium]